MIQGLTVSLEYIKIRKNIIERKYFLAIYKEKRGNLEEAEKLYKEIIKKGNRLYVTGEAKKKLENINNSKNKSETVNIENANIEKTVQNNQKENNKTIDIDQN